MRRMSFILTFVFLAALPLWAAQPQLPAIDRTLVREPAYKNPPKYFVLLFGADAKTRIWCVLDGEVLFADLNGNGDLTEPGERFPLDQRNRFWLGEIKERDGKTTHRNVWLSPMVARRGETPKHILVKAEIKGEWEMHTYVELNLAAQRPQDATFRHFNGPLRPVILEPDKVKLVPGGKPCELGITIDTYYPQLEASVRLGQEKGVPKDVHPIAEIVFPKKSPTAPAIMMKVPLAQRSGGGRFYDFIQVPAEAGVGKATITISFPDWKGGEVIPTTYEVPVVD